MVIFFVVMMLVGACGLAMLPRLRGSSGPGAAVPGPPVAVVLELPVELQHLPEPPVLEAAPVQILDRAQALKRLRELELNVVELGQPSPEHESLVAGLLAAIGDATTQRRYAPRRPNLLPQLMRAVADEDVSRRELAAIIARDPSLVGSLLKMANSAYYRVGYKPVESIERAVVILGSDGLRSLIAAAVMQPIFHASNAGAFPRFPEVVWEHALRSAHAAIPHAAVVERADPFSAELLSLITGLAEIVVFRATMDHYATVWPRSQPDPRVIAALLDSHAASFAWRIGADWELSELLLAALEEQMVACDPTTPLGRSLRFGRCAGALAVLHTNSLIDDVTLKISLPQAGLSPAHLKCMLTRLLNKHEDPRAERRPEPRKAA
jgi:HD-like signal output (HDOD) protein